MAISAMRVLPALVGNRTTKFSRVDINPECSARICDGHSSDNERASIALLAVPLPKSFRYRCHLVDEDELANNDHVVRRSMTSSNDPVVAQKLDSAERPAREYISRALSRNSLAFAS